LSNAKRRKVIELSGIAAVSLLVLYFAYVSCFAYWMVAYWDHDAEKYARWVRKFYIYVSAFAVCSFMDLFLIVRSMGRRPLIP
jgi:hypothetical protein